LNIFQAIKEFHVSLYQALVLLLFNEHKDLSYKDIQEQTKIRLYYLFDIQKNFVFEFCSRSGITTDVTIISMRENSIIE
jgi:hypothetical protein